MTVIEIRDYTRMCLTYSELSKACAIAPTPEAGQELQSKMDALLSEIMAFRKRHGLD